MQLAEPLKKGVGAGGTDIVIEELDEPHDPLPMWVGSLLCWLWVLCGLCSRIAQRRDTRRDGVLKSSPRASGGAPGWISLRRHSVHRRRGADVSVTQSPRLRVATARRVEKRAIVV